MIHHIHSEGLKGAPNGVDLTSAIYIHGANGRQKTAIFDALALLVDGYHPSFPKTGDGVLQLASGDLLRVEVYTGDWALSRTWERTVISRGKDAGQLRVSATVEATRGSERLNGTDAKAQISELLGEPGSLDLGQFLATTDSQRRRQLLAAGSQAVDLSPDDVARMATRHGADVPSWSGAGLLEWITDLYDEAQSATKAARATLASRREAARALDEESEPIDPAVVGRARDALDALMGDLQQTESHWAREISRAETAAEEAGRQSATRERLTREVADVDRQLAALRDQDVDVSDDLAELRRQRQGLTSGWSGADALARAATAATAAATAARGRLAEARDHQLAVEQAERELEIRERRVSEDLDRCGPPTADLERRVVSLRDLMARGATCPTCGGTPSRITLRDLDRELAVAKAEASDEAQPLRRQLDEIEAARAAMRPRLAEAAEVVRVSREQADAADDDRRSAVSRSDRAHQQLLDLDRQIEAMERRDPGDLSMRIAALTERREGLDVQIRGLEAVDVAGARQTLSSVESAATTAKDEIRAKIGVARGELSALEKRLHAREHAVKMRSLQDEAEEAYRAAKEHETQIGPSGLMGAIVALLLAPFEEAVRALTDSLGLGKFAVRLQDDRGSDVFWLGMVDEAGGFRRVEGLSSGEQTAIHAAILVGLAQISRAPWRPVLADHTERLDLRRRESFLRALVEYQRAGHCTQVIAAGCPDVQPAIDGLNVVEV